MVLDDAQTVQQEGSVTLRGHWSIVHATRAGETVRMQREAEWVYFSLLEVEATDLFDYDNDGEPELVLRTLTNVHEGADAPHGEVLTFAQGAVTPCAPAAGLEPSGVVDEDHDQRPDLRTHAPYRADGDAAPSDFTYLMEGPEFLVHALPNGSFSRDDAVAKAFATRVCPARVATVFPARIESESAAQTAVVCARVWNAPAGVVTRAIQQRCAAANEVSSGRPTRRPHCGDARVLTRWAALTPPLTLP